MSSSSPTRRWLLILIFNMNFPIYTGIESRLRCNKIAAQQFTSSLQLPCSIRSRLNMICLLASAVDLLLSIIFDSKHGRKQQCLLWLWRLFSSQRDEWNGGESAATARAYNRNWIIHVRAKSVRKFVRFALYLLFNLFFVLDIRFCVSMPIVPWLGCARHRLRHRFFIPFSIMHFTMYSMLAQPIKCISLTVRVAQICATCVLTNGTRNCNCSCCTEWNNFNVAVVCASLCELYLHVRNANNFWPQQTTKFIPGENDMLEIQTDNDNDDGTIVNVRDKSE